MIRRPTVKAGIVAAIGALLVVVGTTAQAGWLFVLAAGVLGLVASGLAASHRLGAARVSRSLPARARVGGTAVMALAVHNVSKARIPVMRIEDRFPAFAELSVACEAVPPGGSASLDVERAVLVRGVHEGGDVTLTTAAPFGLLRTRRKAALASRMIVHPEWGDVGAFALPETPAATADEAMALARAGQGEVFAGVRDYRPGDQRRWVHWRTTARTGRLVVREHEEPAKSPVVLVVAGDPAGDPEEWERTVAGAASVGVFALAKGRPVHCAGAGYFEAFQQDVTKLQLLDWCAGLEPSELGLADGVTGAFRRWGRRCSFVLFGNEGEDLAEAARLAASRGAHVCSVHRTTVAVS